jgi:hypothetical protein
LTFAPFEIRNLVRFAQPIEFIKHVPPLVLAKKIFAPSSTKNFTIGDVNKRGIYRQVEPTKVNIIVPPLWCAAETGQIDIARILISHGADVNKVPYCHLFYMIRLAVAVFLTTYIE